MIFPKYLTELLESGQLRFFSTEAVAPVEVYNSPFGTTFAILYPERGTDEQKREKATALAEKIIALSKREDGSGILGDEDWLWFMPEDKSRGPVSKIVPIKVPFRKFAIHGPVEKTISKNYSWTRVKSDPMASELTSIFRGQTGHFIQRSRLEYLKEADKALFQGKRILHSRCDHDKYRWFTSWFTDEKDYPSRISVGEEATKITFDVLRLFPNGLRQMREMFYSGEVDKVSEDEGNLYYFGEKANYWIRLITRQGDYNLYVFAYEKW